MRPLALALFALVLLPAGSALAHEPDAPSNITLGSGLTPPARWAPRQDPDQVRMAITTEDGGATLVLTGDVVAIQLSDRTLREVRRKLRHEQKEEEDNVLAQVIKSVVLSSVRSMLDHSLECPIRDLREVEYRNGRLIFTTRAGGRLFEGIDVNDRGVLEGFSERDARAFANEFHRGKRRSI